MTNFIQYAARRGVPGLALLCSGAVAFSVATAQPAPAVKPAATATATAKAKTANTPAIGTPAPTTAAAGSVSGGLLELDWERLLPKDYKSRGIASGAPAPIHDYLGEAGPAAQQVADYSVNVELNGIAARLPGFIVPLDVGKDGVVTEFFLVPYFGACIHVPPPPPNQIVYVHSAKGIALDSIYEAYWVSGRMTVQSKSTQLGSAAYRIDADKVEIYKY